MLQLLFNTRPRLKFAIEKTTLDVSFNIVLSSLSYKIAFNPTRHSKLIKVCIDFPLVFPRRLSLLMCYDPTMVWIDSPLLFVRQKNVLIRSGENYIIKITSSQCP